MIVISGALVIVALGLLIAGLVVSSGLVLVYASIGVSVLSAIFLFLGVRQRRDEGEPGMAATPGLAATDPAPGAAASTAVAAPAVAPVTEDVRPVSRPATPPPPPVEPVTPEPAVPAAAPVPVTAPDVPAGGEVYVVPGRPRYHAVGCRYLSGRDTEARDVESARAEGFTACGVCRPDDRAGTPAAAPAAAPATPTTTRRPQSRTAQSDSPAAASARARKAPATEPSSTAPGRAVAAETAATPASSRSRAESVIVIPERGRFHRAECRYVRGVESAREMTKSGAKRQGYSPCGVCKP